jgi:DNA-binding NarL/FixJ family response regulator
LDRYRRRTTGRIILWRLRDAVGVVAIIRTLVATVAPLLGDLIREAVQPPLTLDVVGVLDTRESLVESLRSLAPDLLLLGLTDSETDAVARSLLVAAPSVAILALAPNGQHAWLYEMRPRRTALTELSVASLVRALRPLSDADAPKG